MRRLRETIADIEKEYLFDRKQAGKCPPDEHELTPDAILKVLRTRSRADAVEARLRQVVTPEVADTSGDSSDAEGDLFGGMLDEPSPASAAPVESSSVMPLRSMAIPKTIAFSGNTPKSLLRRGLEATAWTSYVKLSGHSRAVRVGLEVLWTTGRRRVWRMDEIACNDLAEAENYASTLALNELSGDRTIPAPNWRTMPPDYRQLWEELEQTRQEQEMTAKREHWAKIRTLHDRGSDVTPPTLPPRAEPPNKSEMPTAASPTPLAPDEGLRSEFLRRQSSPSYQAMLAQRRTLPIATFRQQIIDTLAESQIVVLSGETGCGKSTQLPAYILEDQLSKGLPCKIYVTEPRRISAISLAQRVSQELGEKPGSVGSHDSLIGYSIRLEAKVSANTRLAFVTNGIALRMLESSSHLTHVTHIVVDEVHERSIESDFLLIVLKQLVQHRPDLKVILMSATLDADKISSFFGGCPTLSVPGRTFPVQVNYLEDAVELARYRIDESSPFAVRNRFAKAGAKQLDWKDDSDADGDDDPAQLSSTRYSVDTVKTINLLDSRQIPYDLIMRLLETICIESPDHQSFSAAILIFMPGLAEIRKLNELLQAHGFFGSADFVIFPLHSSISSEGQGAVFDIPPPGIRKIVICTSLFTVSADI